MRDQSNNHDPAAYAELNRLVDELLDQSADTDEANRAIDALRAERNLPDSTSSAYDDARRSLEAFDEPLPTPNLVHSVIDRLDRRVGFSTPTDRRWIGRARKGLAAAAIFVLAAGFIAQRFAPSDPIVPQANAGFAAPSTDTAAPVNLTASVAQAPATDTFRDFTEELATSALPHFPAFSVDFDHSHLDGIISPDTQVRAGIRIIRDFSLASGNGYLTLDVDSSDTSSDALVQLIGQLDQGLVTNAPAPTHAAVLTDEAGRHIVLLATSTDFRSHFDAMRNHLPGLAEHVVPEGVHWIVLPGQSNDR